jgi:hypothetical protein
VSGAADKVAEAPVMVNLIPSWTAATRIYMAVLRNPRAGAEAVAVAEEELLRMAAHVDAMQAEGGAA